ncbi:MAG TPA: hypothetical protein VF916_09800, partial [Ktedonobacterales bacterium]
MSETRDEVTVERDALWRLYKELLRESYRLQAENDALREERNSARAEVGHPAADYDALHEIVDALANEGDYQLETGEGSTAYLARLVVKARAVLAKSAAPGGDHVVSTTPTKDIPDSELAYEREIAYDDLGYVLARIVAIGSRLQPGDSRGNLLGWSLGYVNGEYD